MSVFEKKDFDFEKKLKQLVRRLNSVTSSVDGNYTEQEAGHNGSSPNIEAGNVVSCQLVNFNSESSNYNEYQVYNYCDNVHNYEQKLEEYFNKKDEQGKYINKSILSIFHKNNDDGIWYSKRDKALENITLSLTDSDYHKPAPTTAVYEKYENEDDCRLQWDNWSNLMYEIYPDKAVSVLAKRIEIPISKSQNLYSGIYITFSCVLTYSQIGVIGRICETLLNEIAFTNLVPNLYESMEKQATRAAITQVNARNNSHNHGAHVMNKLTNPDFLEKFCSYANCLKSYKPDADFTDVSDHRPFSQLAIFNNYLKCRMDYLADIALGTPVMQTNKYVYQDLFKELDKVRLLLEHISGLPDFEYKIEFKRNGKRFKASKRNKEDNEAVEDDLLVAIPNDILGTQAFYNILENIIRNTAKHSKKNVDEKGKTQLTIFTVNFIDAITDSDLKSRENNQEIENILNEMIAVEIYDNIDVKGNEYILTDDDKTEYKSKMRKDASNKFSAIEGLVFNQNKNLNEDILKDNKLRSGSLGLVEMDASATYLRKRDVSYINHPNYDLTYDEYWSSYSKASQKDNSKRGTDCRNFLKAFIKNDDKGSHLGYRFFLLRPAVALVVIESLEFDKTKIIELKKNGIWVITKDTFKEELEGKKEGDKIIKAGKVYNHEFVLYTDDNDGEVKALIEKYKTSLPIRILSETDGTNTIENLLTKTASEIEECCWRMWGNKVIGDKKVDILNGFQTSDGYRNVLQAVFLDHLYSNTKTCAAKEAEWKNSLKAFHLEALSSNAQTKMPDFIKIIKKCQTQLTETKDQFKDYLKGIDYSNAGNNPGTYRKLVEAVLTKIIVIDERIQEAAENMGFMKVPFKCLYRKMNVIVPAKKPLNLSANTLADIKTDIEKYIGRKIKNPNSNSFILIHYSILERMYEKKEINTKLDEWARSINVVVTSGRGIPDNLSEKVRFVNLSSVITAFIDIRSKYTITYLLNSSRKSNKI